MSSPHQNQLEPPDEVQNDSEAKELASIWTSNDQQYFLLNVRPYADEPAAWGIFAMDLMKHAARALEQLDGRSREDAYKQILMGFMAEMQDPTEPL